MGDIFLEVVRVIPVIIIFVYFIYAGRKFKQQKEIGWKYIVVGFGLILFASIIDITDNFGNLNRYIVIGDTEIQAFLEKVVGYLGGFILLAVGFLKWFPKIMILNQTQRELVISKKKLQVLNVGLEKKVRERTKELESINKVKEKTLRKLKKSNQTKTLFLDILRHDILNSVTVIKGGLALIIKKKKERLLENSLSSANKIQEIVESAKKYALVEGEKEIEKEPIDLRKVIGDVCTEIRPRYKKENIKLINNISSSIKISGNKILREVFLNLLTNALKYAKEGKKVEIFSKVNKNVVIKFVDYGPGISDEFKEQVFERLERKDKRSIKGTGLGLAIAKRIIELHNGRVFVEDNPKGGSVFVVELPK